LFPDMRIRQLPDAMSRRFERKVFRRSHSISSERCRPGNYNRCHSLDKRSPRTNPKLIDKGLTDL